MTAAEKYRNVNLADATRPRFRFGAQSLKEQLTLHPDLIRILDAALATGIIDFTILEGHRGQAKQDAAFRAGLSKVRWPHGNHNTKPSTAADLAPYPLDWSNTSAAHERFALLAGVVMAVAVTLYRAGQTTHRVRYGGDWDMDGDTRDEKFRDYGHFELVAP